MSLSPGARLGPYEIVSPLGAGGMGEVYRAKDGRLNRTVAIKILSDESAGDADRRERFEREAKAISALDHPNICALYDVGEHEGTHFLVMPCLEGQTLADRLAKGALPPDQAIKYAIEIATALDAAHRHGIIHRDLKPGNIMLTKTGVKLLDFGLAKLKKAGGPLTYSGMANLAGETTQATGTGIGTLLGTMPYMAPEQVEGRDVDARSDIFSLGAVIYEMITGRRAFKGESPASVIGAILKDEPTPMKDLQPLAPAVLDHVVTACLAKDPDERWQSAADVARELKWVAQGDAGAVIGRAASRRKKLTWPMALVGGAALIAAAVAAWPAFRAGDTPSRVARFELMPPASVAFSASRSAIGVYQAAVSPDGSHITYVASHAGKQATLWIRNIDEAASRELSATNGAADPFWSPDSTAIGFFSGGRLKTIAISSGTVRDIAAASSNSRGGSWSRNGTILFSPDSFSPLWSVPAAGGTPVSVTSTGDAVSHRWPWFLPDADHFLFFGRGDSDQRGIYIGSLAGGAPKLILRNVFAAQYARGYLFTIKDGSLLAYPFDVTTLELNDTPAAVASGVGGSSTQQGAFSVSDTLLVHSSGHGVTSELQWFDRTGQAVGKPVDHGNIANFALSDDARLAVGKVDATSNTADIWLVDLTREVTTRFTLDPMNDLAPVWSPDGNRIIYRSDRLGGNNLFVKSATGADEEKLLLKRELAFPTDWSPDARYVLYHQTLISSDISATTLDGRSIVPVAATRFDEYDGRFSPDGRWVAYVSEESGRPEVYVQSFPPSGDRWTVTSGGGAEPRWRRDGRELFVLSADGVLMSVAVSASARFESGVPKRLFPIRTSTFGNLNRMNLEVSGDGQRFLVNMATKTIETQPISVVVNWMSALPARERR